MATAMGMVWRLTVTGRPVSKKNSKEIAKRRDGSPMIVSNPKAKAWEAEAVKQLRGQWATLRPIDTVAAVVVVSYLHPKQPIDVDNLLPAPLDALQSAGVIANDNLFSVALSVRRRDRENPRVEICVYERAEDFMRDFAPGYDTWAP